jgi:hypothetical protein
MLAFLEIAEKKRKENLKNKISNRNAFYYEKK